MFLSLLPVGSMLCLSLSLTILRDSASGVFRIGVLFAVVTVAIFFVCCAFSPSLSVRPLTF